MIEQDVQAAIWLHQTFYPSGAVALQLISGLGNGLVLGAFVVVGWFIFDRANLRRHFVALAAVTILTGLGVTGLKFGVSRPRPAFDERCSDALHADARSQSPTTPSFPSGHAQTAFVVAGYLMVLYPRLAAPLCLMAVLVGVSRVGLGVHFPSDVLTGSVIGFTGGLITARWRRGRRSLDRRFLTRPGAPP